MASVKRSLRTVINLLTAVSLLLGTAVAVLWVRSYRPTQSQPRDVCHRISGLEWLEFGSDAGELHALRAVGFEVSVNPPTEQLRLRVALGKNHEALIPVESMLPLVSSQGLIDSRHAGYLLNFERGHVSSTSSIRPVPNVWPTYQLLTLGHGLVVAFFSLFPVTRVVAWGVRRVGARRGVPGRCSNCSYDLRATPERCPECGAVPVGVPT
jgi:hypothetical protein